MKLTVEIMDDKGNDFFAELNPPRTSLNVVR